MIERAGAPVGSRPPSPSGSVLAADWTEHLGFDARIPRLGRLSTGLGARYSGPRNLDRL